MFAKLPRLMAKLPTFEQLGTMEAPRPELGVVQSRAGTADNDIEGRAIAQTGAELQRVSNEMFAFKEKVDTTRVEDAWNQYKNAALDYTSGEKGLLKTMGADAVNGDLLGKSNALMADARKKIGDGLTNDDQRRRFAERADATDLDTKRSVLGHLAQQQVQYSKTVFEGSEAAAKAQVAAAPTDPGVFKGAHETLMAQADQYLKQNGVTDKGVADALKGKLNDSLWSTRINGLLYSQPALADALFRANSKEIKDPELRLVLQNKTREVAMGVVATNEAQGIIDEVRSDQIQARRVAPQDTLTPVTNDSGDPMRVSPALQLQRDQQRLSILRQELKDDPNDKALQREIANTEASVAKQEKGAGGAVRVSQPAADPIMADTSGMPNSRDVAAQLPIMMAKVNKRADALYGPDQGNPDRAAFIKRLTSELQNKVSQDVQQLNALQREAQDTIYNAVLGIKTGGAAGGLVATGGQPGGGLQRVSSMSQIQSNPELLRAWQMLDGPAKVAATTLMDRALKPENAGDVMYQRELWNRIHLAEGDPNKINFYQQLVDPQVANRLSLPQINELRAELERSETPGGRSLNQLRKAAGSNVEAYFKTNIMFTAQPERQIAATMRWNEEVGKKVDQYVKEGRGDQVRSMFMLDSKDSVVSPAYLQTFVNSTPAQGLATQASDVRAGAKPPMAPIIQPKDITTRDQLDKWLLTLPEGVDRFVGSDGKTRAVPPRADKSGAAQSQYRFVQGLNIKRIDTPAEGKGYAETWAIGEEGAPNNPRPKELPLNQHGIQVFKPDQFSEHDVAGEALHLDPVAHRYRDDFAKTLSADQIKVLKEQPDYKVSEGMPEPLKMRNAVDAAMRGYLVGQWPKQAVDEFFTPPQRALLDKLKVYMTTGNEQGVTMDPNTGKIVPPPTTTEQPIPKLVVRESMADKARRMKEEAGIRGADKNVALVEGVLAGAKAVAKNTPTALVVKGAKAAGSAVADVALAANPSEPERAARSFRELVQLGSYTPQSETVILDAMDSGMLTPAEERTARAMLRQLAGTRKK